MGVVKADVGCCCHCYTTGFASVYVKQQH